MRRKPATRSAMVAVPLAMVVAGCVAWGLRDRSPQGEKMLPQLLQALEKRDFNEAQTLAQSIWESSHGEPRWQGLTLYVRGARLATEAQERFDEEERRAMHRAAAGYLQQALGQGLPPELHDRAFLQTAISLNRAARFAATVRFLENGLEAGEPNTTAVDRLLAAAYAHVANPQWEDALERIDRYLADRNITPAERQAAMLERFDILLGLNRDDEAAKLMAAFSREGPFASRVLVNRARLLVRQAERIRNGAEGDADSMKSGDLLAEAMRLLNDVKEREAIDQHERRRADYLYAVCLRDSGDMAEALDEFSAVRRLHVNTPSGLSAGLGEAEMLQHAGRAAEALESFRRLLSEAPLPNDYSNPWMSLDGFRARLSAAYARWLGQHKHEEAIILARALPPVIPADRAMLLHAEARTQWANHLEEQAERLSFREAAEAREQARRQHRLAGVAYAKLALLRPSSREYPDDVWRSGESYFRGRDFYHAARMLQFYLDQETRPRRADAQTLLGESLMALGELDRALKMLERVVESYPQHPAQYRARVLAAQTHLELNDLNAAKKLLRANLENESLTPQSIEWRDSLFLLGETLLREGQTLEAESRRLGVDAGGEAGKAGLEKLHQSFDACRGAAEALDEALARYPDAPQALRAGYFLAEAHREAAKYPRKRLPGIALEATRNSVEREMQTELTKAADAYASLIERLTGREKSGELDAKAGAPLTPVEKGMLRNAYFGRADALFDLGRYEEAIRAYTLAANRYQNEPAALEAFVQIASCHRRMRRPTEAAGVLEQAKVVLGRIPPDADFLRSTRYARKQWEELLELLSTAN